ncbi:MAG: DUF6273 domain-containing protein, partial [Agathobacter sp.]
VRNQELLTYDTKWNDLEVTYDSNNLVTQHLITYVNANGEVLYEHYVDQGSVPPDPVAEGYIDTPTMESTAQYDFAYTGWDDVTSIALAPRTVTALYSSTVRKYTVTWYSRAGLSLGSVEADYGSDVTYSGEIPTNTSQESTYVYNIFAGWDKSTGYITGDIDVYAVWEKSELPTIGKQLKDMTDAEIYAVATSGKANEYFESKDYHDITLGHDFNFSNVECMVVAENQYFDGATAIDTGIKLFGAEEKSFTLAIDYQFTSTETNNTLVSCFEEDGSEGFRLRYNTHPNVQWGSANQSFGCKTRRDIVVLRHIKGDDKLYIYASNKTSTSENVFDDEIFHEIIVRNRLTDTESTLVLGAVKFLEDGGYDYYGKGFIHWCKIWFDDLGDANARALASWYHEPLRMEFCGAGRYRLAGGGSQKCGASFVANNLLLDRGHIMNPTATNAGGWNGCKMRPFLNGKFLSALPITWQAMLKTVKINASAGSQSTEILISEDKVYLVSYKEVYAGTTDTTYVAEGDPIDFFTDNPSRIKFRGRIVPEDATFFSSNTEPSAIASNNVKEGDIWINTANNSIGYMYVSQDEIDKYNLTPYATAAIGGGWISATNWWERSPYVSHATNFMFVSSYGYPGNGSNASYTYGVCPCFSI